MAQPSPKSDWRLVHGVTFALLMACALVIPAMWRWPWIWLAPFIAYFILVACIPNLRRSLHWLCAGRLSVASVTATFGIMILTASALVLFHAIAQPDVRGYRVTWQFDALGGVLMAGIIFTVINATMEELIFRGVLFDALESQWGIWITLVVTSLLFGLGHLRGYPSGVSGACLAMLFGFIMGALRLWTRGLALPIIAHMGADATIYGILVYSGAA